MPLEPFPWILPIAEDLARYLKTSSYVTGVSIGEVDDEHLGRFTNIAAETTFEGKPKPDWQQSGYESGSIKLEYKIQGEDPKKLVSIVDSWYGEKMGLFVRTGNSEFPIQLSNLDLSDRDRSTILEVQKGVDSYLGKKYKRYSPEGESGIFLAEQNAA